MSNKRIIYQNWIVDLGIDPASIASKDYENSLFGLLSDEISKSREKKSTEKLISAVGQALEKLNDDEREFVTRHYFMGESLTEIAEQSNREIYKIAAFQSRILRKLKIILSTFVKYRYKIPIEKDFECVICESSQMDEINSLIINRDMKKTWKPLMDYIKGKYKLVISTPQVMIGHEKYHLTELKKEQEK